MAAVYNQGSGTGRYEYGNIDNAKKVYNARNKNQSTNNSIFAGAGVSQAEYTPDLDAILKRNNVRYGMSYASFDDLISYFNVSRLPDYEGMTMPLVGHLIFTRPSLYIDINGNQNSIARKNYEQLRLNPKTATYINDKYGQRIANMLSEYSTTPYMPMFTTRAMSYAVGDVSLKTVEKSQTFFGHILKYGKHSEEHKVGGTVSIDFRNDRYQSILKAASLWMNYIMIISKSDNIVPSETSQQNGVIDYAGSLYYFVTWMDMSRLIYWEKLTGIFPKNLPLSMFSYNDAPIIEDKLTIEFEYGARSEPNDPDILMDINTHSLGSYSALAFEAGAESGYFGKMVRPDSFEGPFTLGDAFATKPMIRAKRRDRTMEYYLQYIY